MDPLRTANDSFSPFNIIKRLLGSGVLIKNPRSNTGFEGVWTEMEGSGRGLDRVWTGSGQCFLKVFGMEEWTLAEDIYAS